MLASAFMRAYFAGALIAEQVLPAFFNEVVKDPTRQVTCSVWLRCFAVEGCLRSGVSQVRIDAFGEADQIPDSAPGHSMDPLCWILLFLFLILFLIEIASVRHHYRLGGGLGDFFVLRGE